MVKSKGFSLIETMITLLVSSIGILGIGILQLQSIKTSADAGQRSNAVWLVQGIAERMRANPVGSREDAYSGKVVCGGQPAKMCASHYASARVAAVTCDASEMAAFDLWELACGFDKQDDKFRASHDFMSALDLELTCTDSIPSDSDACSTGSKIDIAMQWNERGVDPASNEITNTATINMAVRL